MTQPRIFPYRKPEFWNRYRSTPAWEFERFAALVEDGKARPPQPQLPQSELAQRQREDLEASLAYTK
ncbi:MAG: hypothetical protein JO022_08205, partial [Acidobacteriaceae bacterium]|nr:hypothetical protein [Acidobacteriaceae bacterium]